MKILSCASYYGCGSSALTDFISEFDDVKSLSEYEFRFIHDIDGISDLEHHLIECPNRHNSGHALKRFKRLSKFNAGTWFNKRYEPFFNNKYWPLTQEYIKSLTAYEAKGFWFYDMFDRGSKIYYYYSFLTKLYKKIPLHIFEPLPNEVQYGTTLSKEIFLENTRRYIHELMIALNTDNKPFLMVDQLLPSSNIERCMKYFADPVILFVFDRDPRDVYILAKKILTDEHIAPTDPVLFSEWFKFSRECAKNESFDSNKVIKLQFEDFIYKYDETKDRIVNAAGLLLSKHARPFNGFNPRRSFHNTQLWKKFPDLQNDVDIITRMLPEYLYNFDAVADNEIKGVTPTSTKPF